MHFAAMSSTSGVVSWHHQYIVIKHPLCVLSHLLHGPPGHVTMQRAALLAPLLPLQGGDCWTRYTSRTQSVHSVDQKRGEEQLTPWVTTSLFFLALSVKFAHGKLKHFAILCISPVLATHRISLNLAHQVEIIRTIKDLTHTIKTKCLFVF